MKLSQYYDDILVGKENAVSRYRLAANWHVSERAARKIIQELRAADFGDDYVIVSSSHGCGYYKTNNLAEIAEFKKEVTRRGKNTFLPLKKVNRILNSAGQVELVGVNRLKEAREAAGLQAKEVVAIIQEKDPAFNKIIMSHIENNKCLPSAAQLQIMAELYNYPPADLVGMDFVPNEINA